MPELSATAPQGTRDPVYEPGGVLQRLEQRLQALEQRVAVLEGTEGRAATLGTATGTAAAPKKPPVAETWAGFPSLRVEPGGMATVLGKAVVGFAGAYLLRAMAESSGIPKIPVILLAIAYAGLWMAWAIRNRERQFASFTFGITSTLILSPLLWETTVRFQFLSPTFAATVLVAFFGFTVLQSWRWNLQVLPWIATVAAVTTACALLVATHELVPITGALLAICIGSEFATAQGHHKVVRFVPAIAADAAVALTIALLGSPAGVPEGYPRAAGSTVVLLWVGLLLIYLASIGVRGFWRSEPITIIDLWQGILVFGVAGFGAFRSAGQVFVPLLGLACMALSAGCYWGALKRFTGDALRRNRRISATWAAMLLIAGTLLALPPWVQAPFLSAAAIVSTVLYTRTAKLSLGLHVSVYLAAGAALSSMPVYIVGAMAGTVPRWPDVGIWVLLLSAAACYGVGARTQGASKKLRALWVCPAALVGFGSVALAVAAVVAVAGPRMNLDASQLSVVRTVLNCGLALGMGYFGLRWKRIELGWIAYAAIVFGTLKLLFEDLRIGNASSLVVSLLFYGLVLILLPRLIRRAKSKLEAA